MPRMETDVSFIDSSYLDQWHGNGGMFTQRSIAKRNASDQIRITLIDACQKDGTFTPEASLYLTEYMNPALAKQLEGTTDGTEAMAIYDRFSSENRVMHHLEYPKNANPRTVTLFNRILVYANPLENEAHAPVGARRVKYSRDVAERTLVPFRELEAVFSSRVHSVQELLRKRVISHAAFNGTAIKKRGLTFEDVIVAMESEVSEEATSRVIERINRIVEEYNLSEMPYIARLE